MSTILDQFTYGGFDALCTSGALQRRDGHLFRTLAAVNVRHTAIFQGSDGWAILNTARNTYPYPCALFLKIEDAAAYIVELENNQNINWTQASSFSPAERSWLRDTCRFFRGIPLVCDSPHWRAMYTAYRPAP